MNVTPLVRKKCSSKQISMERTTVINSVLTACMNDVSKKLSRDAVFITKLCHYVSATNNKQYS